jgi:Uma2 family endonuclease
VGILAPEDRVELMDGEIVVMTPIGPRHGACVARATRELVRAAGDAAIVLPQGSVRLDLYYEPQPDLALLRPRGDFYASRHAGPPDILLIVEIADSSLDYDRDVKARVYAAAGIPEYWLADLRANVVWRYRSPDRDQYRDVEPFRRGQSIAVERLPACIIPVDALLAE